MSSDNPFTTTTTGDALDASPTINVDDSGVNATSDSGGGAVTIPSDIDASSVSPLTTEKTGDIVFATSPPMAEDAVNYASPSSLNGKYLP
ncbi:hypothetical protein K474DRAFT_1713268 [Panus rudis PR-1116 ss-1]|nr:hypothetical protein K474DRAFT_1713268 [Panus rudis PR-1116 ss-1]